jgi:hypothetical protein
MENVALFYDLLDIRNILGPFGIIYEIFCIVSDHLVYFDMFGPREIWQPCCKLFPNRLSHVMEREPD